MSNKDFWLAIAIMFVAVVGLSIFLIVYFEAILMIGGKY